ncbi:9951_t:CDS:2 [Funneliformis caledonium]|uniref:9951_t:CDS:1 n=1 Tax=Funneliformis caledonium TaxID=1117310 RepID=A0A9N9GH69_9GLOM|nr:9951_t:CDS:2 [Funneliformis caledonium]
MTEETIPLTPLSNHDNEGEGSNQTASLSNKRSKKQRSEHVSKKVKTLEKTHKYKSWVWKWWDPVLLDNGNAGAEYLVKKTDEQLCGKVYSSGNSTSNLIVHLAGSHQITENTDVKERSIQTTLTNN